MEEMFTAGESVVFAKMPKWVVKLPKDSRAVFEFCLGGIYTIEEIDEDGLLVLDVSADVDEVFGGFMNDIRVEPEYVTVTD